MTWLGDHWFAVLLFLAYSGVLFWNARVGLRSTKGSTDYFVGGRRMGGVVIGVSFYATFASTNSYLGHAGKGYEYGIAWLIMPVFLVAFAYLSWKFVAPRMRRFAAEFESVTIPDFLAARFASESVRRLTAVVIIFSSLLYLVAIFKGVGNLFETFLGVRYEVAVAINLVIVMLYTSLGGFVSVVRTDVLQGALMVVGSVLLFVCVTSASGGIGMIASVTELPTATRLFALDTALPFVVVLGIALAGSLKLLVDPRQVSRFYGLRDERSIRTGIWVAVIGILVIQFCLFPVGLYAHFLLDPVADTDVIVPTLVNDPLVVPPLLGDFLVVAILGAAMSSLDSVLLVAASVTTRDLLKSRREVVSSRLLVVGFAVVAAVIALNPPGGIVELTIFSGSLYAVCFIPTLLVGLHWRRGDARSAVASMALGMAVLFGWLLLDGQSRFGVHEVFPALIVSCTVYVIDSWRRVGVSDPAVQRFFA